MYPQLATGDGEMVALDTIAVDPIPVSEALRRDGDLHKRLIRYLTDLADASKRYMEQRFTEWDEADEQFRLYVDLRRKNEDTGKREMPFERAFAVPLLYWTLLTRMATMWTVFDARDPFLHFEGAGGSDDYKGARLLEALARWHLSQSGLGLTTWQLLFDSERYGTSILYDHWCEEHGWLNGKRPNPFTGQMERFREWGLRRQYNRWDVIDPYRFLPDPNVGISDVQRMDYVGHYDIVSWFDLDRGRLERNEGTYFNVDEARKLQDWRSDEGSQGRNIGGSFESTFNSGETTRRVPRLKKTHLICRIIPREWGLSDGDRQEKWMFTFVNEEVIVRALPLLNWHGEYPYAVGQPDPDRHAPFTPGTAQQLKSTQRTVTWFHTSHIANIRKIGADRPIYARSLLEEADVLNPRPGSPIRLTPLGEKLVQRGLLNIPQMFGQFAMQDVTGNHIEMSQLLMQQAQRMTATPDSVQGMPLPTKRTLGEVQQVTSSATQRIGVTAKLMDAMLFRPAALRLVANIQQFMSDERVIRVAGSLAKELGVSTVWVRPEDVWGNYDYIPHTQTDAIDPARLQQVWVGVLQLIASAPQLMAPDPITGKQLDPHAIFNELIRVQGVRYFDQFYRQVPGAGMRPQGGPPPQIMGAEETAMQRQAGNIVPIEQAMMR